MSTKTILTPNLSTLGIEIQEAVLDGYTINPDMPLNMFGTYYEVVMFKDDVQEEFVQEPVKRMGRKPKEEAVQ